MSCRGRGINRKPSRPSTESLKTDEIHGDWLSLLPSTQLLVLDVGAGSGRDAAWFAKQNHEVVAVEPADALRQRAQAIHPSPRIPWIDDQLPALDAVHGLDYAFDVILLSAVWMHVPPSQRERAFRKLTELLKPGGHLVITLRSSPPGTAERPMKPPRRNCGTCPALLPSNFWTRRTPPTSWDWTAAVFRLPDDGTGALPLIRHILINDNTSATYKPALLRSILRVAENAKGAVLHEARGYVDIPLGLVALYWLRMFRGLILDRGYAQMPKGNGSPKFDNEHFRFLGMEGATTMLVHVEHGMPTPPSVLFNSPGGVLHLNQAFRIEVSVHSCQIGPLLPAQ